MMLHTFSYIYTKQLKAQLEGCSMAQYYGTYDIVF